MKQIIAAILAAATLLGGVALTAAARDFEDRTTWKPIPCEWYPPGWPEMPDWQATDGWSIIDGDEASCDIEPTEPVDEAEEYVEPVFGVQSIELADAASPPPVPRMTLPPTDTE